MVNVPNCELEMPAYGTGGWTYGPNPTGGSTTFSGRQFGGPTDV
jgi:hypothetical protein